MTFVRSRWLTRLAAIALLTAAVACGDDNDPTGPAALVAPTGVALRCSTSAHVPTEVSPSAI